MAASSLSPGKEGIIFADDKKLTAGAEGCKFQFMGDPADVWPDKSNPKVPRTQLSQ